MRRLVLLSILSSLALIGAANAVELKIATALPENSQFMIDMREGAAAIKAQTEGRVILKIYGGGSQGNDKKVLQKIQIGQLHGGAFTPSTLQDKYGDLNLYGLPFVFRSADEVIYVREKMDARMIQGLEDAGFVSFGFSGAAFAVLFSQTPVHGVKDLAGKKVWVPEGDPISYAAMKDLGLAPVTLPLTDVMTGLQTGLLDIVAIPPVTALLLQWYTKVNYMTRMPILYTMGYMAIQKKAFDRLSESDQAVFRSVMNDVYKKFDEASWTEDAEATEALINKKIESVQPDEEEMAEIRSLIMKTNRRMGEDGIFSITLFDEMLKHLADFRAQQEAEPDPAANSCGSADGDKSITASACPVEQSGTLFDSA